MANKILLSISLISIIISINFIAHINTLTSSSDRNNNLAKQQDFKVNSNCLIENEKYDGEFLYTCEFRDYPTPYVDPHNSKYIQDFDQMRWIFTPANNNDDNSTFYIINSFYDMLLCSGNSRIGLFSQRRKLNMQNLFKINEFDNEECIWYVEPAEKLYKKYIKSKKSDKNRYVIWNYKYAEPLYAGSFLLKQVKSKRRNIYTWYKKPNSAQFIWNLHCL